MTSEFETACALAAAVRDGSKRAADIIDASLARIAERNPQVSAFVEVHDEDARRQAAEIDAARERGRPDAA